MRIKILQNVVKIYFTSLCIPLIVWELLVKKKFLENIHYYYYYYYCYYYYYYYYLYFKLMQNSKILIKTNHSVDTTIVSMLLSAQKKM